MNIGYWVALTQDMNYQWKTPRAIKAQEKIKMQAKKAKGQNPRKLAPRVRTTKC